MVPKKLYRNTLNINKLKKNLHLFMNIYHFLKGFVHSRHSNDDKFPRACLIDHEMLTSALHPESNKEVKYF